MTSASADQTASSRTVTPRVSRRAWLDPHVRIAWLLGLLLLAVGCILLAQRVSEWRESAKLINDGIPVDATVTEIDGFHVPGRSLPGDKPVSLHFERDGKSYDVKALYLEGRLPEESLTVGKTVRIRVNPDDPTHWTPRQSPTPLTDELVGSGILLSTGIIFLIIAGALRSRLLKTFRTAPQIDAVVLNARHTAIAPRAWLVRCSPTAEGDNRVFTVYLPPRKSVANASLHLLAAGRGRALSLEWFE